jgi:ATP-dependent Clp protease, protease subunit
MTRKKVTRRRDTDLMDSSYEHHSEDESRTVYLVGDIDEELIRSAVERITVLSEKKPKKPITLIINTYGGNVDDTFMLYDLMKYIPTPIHTVGLGKIMSAGCLLLAAGVKGKRKMGRNARVMYHCGWEYTGGTIFEMRANLQAFERQEAMYDQRFAEETSLTIEQVEALYDKNGPTSDHYLTAEQALQLGIVDELI